MKRLATLALLCALGTGYGCEPAPIAAPQEAPKIIPKHVFDTLPASEQERFKAEGYEVVEDASQPQGIPGGQPIPGR